jgi:hypothetical protein
LAERLTIGDWSEFSSIHQREFGLPPRPTEAIVVVERREGRIVGFGVVRIYTVLESFWVAPEERGRGVLTHLCAAILSIFPNMTCCFAFTQGTRLVKLFQHMGMELLDHKVLRWTRS